MNRCCATKRGPTFLGYRPKRLASTAKPKRDRKRVKPDPHGLSTEEYVKRLEAALAEAEAEIAELTEPHPKYIVKYEYSRRKPDLDEDTFVDMRASDAKDAVQELNKYYKKKKETNTIGAPHDTYESALETATSFWNEYRDEFEGEEEEEEEEEDNKGKKKESQEGTTKPDMASCQLPADSHLSDRCRGMWQRTWTFVANDEPWGADLHHKLTSTLTIYIEELEACDTCL